MSEGLLASVIVCVFNRERQIGLCLDSLLAMDCEPFEIVAVDDASTDGTVAILERYADECEGRQGVSFQIVRNPKNLGVSGARNEGIAAARGEFVAFTDSDCVVEPGWLAALLGEFVGPKVAAVGGMVTDVPPRTYGELVYRGTCRIGRPGQGRFIVGCNMAFRREILKDYLFDTALSYYCDEDELSWRLASDGFERRYTPDARVTHDHTMTYSGLLTMARKQGYGSARFWYKHDRWIGRDMVLWLATLGLTALGFLYPIAWLAALAAWGVLLAALFANEILFKRKSVTQAVVALPGLVPQALSKLLGVFATYARILTGKETTIVRSKEAWQARNRGQR